MKPHRVKLQRMLAEQKIQDAVETFIAYQKIKWLTIPPRSPHFEGQKKTAVKSLKRHLTDTTGRGKDYATPRRIDNAAEPDQRNKEFSSANSSIQ